MNKIAVDITLAGAAVDPASITLADQDAGYGMREKESGAILVAAGTPFVNTGVGSYEYDFSALATYEPGVGYEFWLAVNLGSQVLYHRGYVPPQGRPRPSGYNAVMDEYKLTLGDLVQLTRILTDDLNGERYSRELVVAALNDAMVEFAQETGLILEDMNVRVYENVFEYDLPALAYADGKRDVIKPIRMLIVGEEEPGFYSRSRQSLQAWYGLGLLEGTPKTFSFDEVDSGKFHLNAFPDWDGPTLSDEDQAGNIEVKYRAIPVWISEDGEFPDPYIPPPWHDALALFAARNLLLDESDLATLQKAVEYDAQFQLKAREAGWSSKSMGRDEGLRPL
jgi:hypothetical protein